MNPALIRSLLFVPASRPERIPKALASGADAVIVDLEDAVAQDAKDSARQALHEFLEQNPDAQVLVRINAPGTVEFEPDLALCKQHAGISGIMVPKAEGCQGIEQAAACQKPVWPLIESPRGVLALPSIVSVAGIERLSFGALDMASELDLIPGTPGAEQILNQCRYDILVNSLSAGLASPVESVYPDIEDMSAVEHAAKRAREMGFSGMLCIHPRQLPPIHQAFMPTDSEIDWAHRVVEHANRGEGVFRIDGQMVDAPVIARAKKILAKAQP